jgi:hypothetical protein
MMRIPSMKELKLPKKISFHNTLLTYENAPQAGNVKERFKIMDTDKILKKLNDKKDQK